MAELGTLMMGGICYISFQEEGALTLGIWMIEVKMALMIGIGGGGQERLLGGNRQSELGDGLEWEN